MSIKGNKLRIRLNLQIDEETKKMSDNLRLRHHINISSLCREAIRNIYRSLNEKNT